MSLTEAIQKATLDEIRNTDILELLAFAEKNHKTLRVQYDAHIIDDFLIEEALTESILKRARKDYQNAVENRCKIDHAVRPECFVYGLDKKIFSLDEIRVIPFDHGETIETFSQLYRRDNLPALLREELLHPGIRVYSNGHIDSHSASEYDGVRDPLK
ncbi:MAG: hypothetical protein ACMXYA_00665 [Candidatus Woesearchaeota archaeon]